MEFDVNVIISSRVLGVIHRGLPSETNFEVLPSPSQCHNDLKLVLWSFHFFDYIGPKTPRGRPRKNIKKIPKFPLWNPHTYIVSPHKIENRSYKKFRIIDFKIAQNDLLRPREHLRGILYIFQ